MLGILLVTYLGSGSAVKSLSMAALGSAARHGRPGPDHRAGPGSRSAQVRSPTGWTSWPSRWACSASARSSTAWSAPTKVQAVTQKIKNIWPSPRRPARRRGRRSAAAAVLGFLIGVLPGGGGVVSSLASYALEKRRAKDPSRFGKGAIEGVAGPGDGQQRRRRRRRSSRCSRSASRPTS